MAKQKKVNFNVFYTCSLETKGEASYIPLTDLFDLIRQQYDNDPNYKVVKNYNFDPIRIKKIEPPNENGYYHIVMERLDDTRYQKTTIYGNSIDIDLEQNEYIGHEISILYDPANNAMLIQRNISSLSPSGIEKYIDSVLFDYYEELMNFKLVPAIDQEAFRKARNSYTFKQLVLKVKGDISNGLLTGLIGNRNYEGMNTVEITITTDHSWDAKLDSSITGNLLDNWIDEESVEKLKVRAIENEFSNIETVDLLKQNIKRSIIYEYREAGELNANNIFLDMLRIYRDDDDAIALLLN